MKHKKLLFIIAFVLVCIIAICVIVSSVTKNPDDNQSAESGSEDTSVIMTQEDDLEILPEVDTTAQGNTTSTHENETSASVTDNTDDATSPATEEMQQDSTTSQETAEERIELPFVPAQ